MKKLVIGLLSVCVAATSVVGCGSNKKAETSVGDNDRISISGAAIGVNNDCKTDDLYKMIADKFNIDVDITSISRSDLSEKTRIMITADTMPDVMFGDWNYNDYVKYSRQGLIKQLPDNYETLYPNIAAELKRTMIMDKLNSVADGKIYAIVRAASFGVIYGKGNDINVGREAFAYRKDWAKELGIHVDSLMSYNDFVDMALKFKKADLGKVGADNVMGMAATPDYAAHAFLASNNNNYRNFYKKDGKYVCGYNETSTVEGIKAYQKAYQDGILHPNFYAHKNDDVPSYFLTGKTGLYYSSWGSSYPDFKRKFEETNPGLSADDCIGLFALKGQDGVLRTRASANYYAAVYFNPKIEDAKFTRILEMIDWISSPEGTQTINYGIKDKDYSVDADGNVNVLLEKNESGVYPSIGDIYKSWNFFQSIASVPYCNLNVNMKDIEELNELLRAKIDAPKKEIEPIDLDMEFYTGEKYVKFVAANDFDAILAELAMSDGDVAAEWNDKMKSLDGNINAVLEDINNDLK